MTATGFIVLTTITDNDGRESYQHSQIYRTREQAEKIASVTRKPKLWEASVVRTVQECRTYFEGDEAEVRPAHFTLGVAA